MRIKVHSIYARVASSKNVGHNFRSTERAELPAQKADRFLLVQSKTWIFTVKTEKFSV